jgi:hypothetical protein
MLVRKLNNPTETTRRRLRLPNNNLLATILSLSSRRATILKGILSKANMLMDLMGLQQATKAACLALSSKLVLTRPMDPSNHSRTRTTRLKTVFRLDL